MFLPTTREAAFAIAAALTSSACRTFFQYTYLQASASSSLSRQWSDIVPSTELQYYDCEGGAFQCARLRLPMDWSSIEPHVKNGTDNDNDNDKNDGDDHVDVAIIRLPARVPVTDPRYGGAIIINPGGPGYSGVRVAMTQGPAAQTIFDAAYTANEQEYLSESAEAKYYDIIGFDPRGINNTTPFLSCLPTTNAEIEWALQGNDAVLGAPGVDPLYLLARSSAYGQDCALSRGSRSLSKITRFMNTAVVVRDVVEIAERHGQWREAQAVGHGPEVQQRLAWRRGAEMINFWGLSYGAMLGASLAAMEPHRVNRFLLDGPNDPHDWYSANLGCNMEDSDATFRHLFTACANAGPDQCALWAGPFGNDTEQQLNRIVERFTQKGPIAVPGDGQARGAQVITLSDVRMALTVAVLLPLKYWFPVASALEPLLRGNGTLMANMKAHSHPILSDGLGQIDPRDLNTHTHHWTHGRRAGGAVKCTDYPPMRDRKQFLETWETMKCRSKWLGDHWATLASDCVGWVARPEWNDADSHALAPNMTANPILFGSSKLDPVTPLAMARRMQARFAGSGLVQVSGAGHTTVSLVNSCAGKAYRKYFQTGEVSDAVCDDETVSSKKTSTMTRADAVLAEALQVIMYGWM